MSAPVDPTVLRRKIAAHRRTGPVPPDATEAAERGFARALRHAAAPFEGLALRLGEGATRAGQTLDEVMAALPEHGLVAVLEGEGEGDEGARGLLALSSGMIDALVEVQTTGRVEQAELPPRPVTRIDEALARDFVDFALSAFARETADVAGRDWPRRMGYGSRVRDRSQISLLLLDGAYLFVSAEIRFDGVARQARVQLILPTDPARAVAPEPAPGAVADPGWGAARRAMLDRLELPLEAVLMRVTRPLREVERLAVGDLIPFGPGELSAVSLETATGDQVAEGRLGQMGGRRALRLPGQPEAEEASEAGPAPPAPLSRPSGAPAPAGPEDGPVPDPAARAAG